MRRHLAATPVVPAPRLGRDVWLKLETLQPTGSFKVRGALVAVTAALARDRRAPIVTASAGNHGLGIAFAADRLGATATVVVPTNASEAKQEAIERFAVELVRHGTSYDEAEAHALALADAGAVYVSPYNDPDVIAGQGTIAIELLEQVPGLTTIVTPIGGGGLASGLGLAASTTRVDRVRASASRPINPPRCAARSTRARRFRSRPARRWPTGSRATSRPARSPSISSGARSPTSSPCRKPTSRPRCASSPSSTGSSPRAPARSASPRCSANGFAPAHRPRTGRPPS